MSTIDLLHTEGRGQIDKLTISHREWCETPPFRPADCAAVAFRLSSPFFRIGDGEGERRVIGIGKPGGLYAARRGERTAKGRHIKLNDKHPKNSLKRSL